MYLPFDIVNHIMNFIPPIQKQKPNSYYLCSPYRNTIKKSNKPKRGVCM